MDAYNFSFMLMNLWRDNAMSSSGTHGKLKEVPVHVEVNGELKRVIDIIDNNGTIILKTEQ